MQRSRRQVDVGRASPPSVAVPSYPIESVDKALKLILLLAEQSEIRLGEATRHLGVASSTAHRMLAMLQYRGFVRQDVQTKAYHVGPAITRVAFAVLGRIDFQGTATPVMRRLSEQLGESVHMGLLEGSTVRFIAAVEGPRTVRVASRLGMVMPAHCTSSGKALLAQLPDEEVKRLYPAEVLEQVTAQSIVARAELLAELGRTRSRGYAVNCEESEVGVTSVAVPIRIGLPGLRMALNASAPSSRLKASRRPMAAAALLEGAREIADRLG